MLEYQGFSSQTGIQRGINPLNGWSNEWQCLEGVYYRKRELYEMKWKSERQIFDLFVVSIAPYGGPIAAVRNEKVFQPARQRIQPVLQTYTGYGTPIASTPWTFSRLICMQWNVDQILVCVFQDGVIRTFTPLCERLHFFSVSDKIKSEGGIIEAKVSSCGIILITASLNIYVNQAFDRPQVVLLPNPGLRGPPLALCTIDTEVEYNDCIAVSGIHLGQNLIHTLPAPKIILCTEDAQVLFIDMKNCIPIELPDGPFIHISASKSGKLIACLSNTGHLKVLSYAPNQTINCIASASLERQRRVQQMEWCGDDCVALYIPMKTPCGDIQHLLFLGGPRNEWLPYQYGTSAVGTGSIYLVPEMDGLRIFNAYKCEFLQRVASSTEAIFSVGSCEAPAMLCYAMERYEAQDAAADESLRSIQQELGAACSACIDAATYEWDAEQSALLLRAAAFGKQFLGEEGRHLCLDFVRACRDIRICVALRAEPVEMPITVQQLRHIALVNIIGQLCRRHHHFLALRICEYVGISPRNVLASWAADKIHHSVELTDEQLATCICDKLAKASNNNLAWNVRQQQYPLNIMSLSAYNKLINAGVDLNSNHVSSPVLPLVRVALCAAQAGRPILATKLAELEQNPTDQVRLLLKLGKPGLATEKAIAFGRIPLVLECITSVLVEDSREDAGRTALTMLQEMLDKKPLAQDIFASYCLSTGKYELLERYYEQCGCVYEAGLMCLYIAHRSTSLSQKKTWLAFAAGFLASARQTNDLAVFAHTETLQTVDLLTYQRDLEVKANTNNWMGGPHHFIGLSTMQTIRQLILRMELHEADALKKAFNIPDKRYWLCKIHALADGKQYDELLAFANYRTSPVGYEPFVDACLRSNNRDAARKLINLITDPESKSMWFLQMGLVEEAAEAAREPAPQKSSFLRTISDVFRRR